MANSPGDSRLLDLPRELRDKIYMDLLRVDGGYVYDFESGKLFCATPAGAREPVESGLALMLSCQQIAGEMHGLALKLNTITFSSVVVPDKKQLNMDYFLQHRRLFADRLFECLQEKDFNHPLRQSDSDWWPEPNFDESVCRTVAEAFPKFEPHLRHIQSFASNPRLHVELFDETGGQVDVDRQEIWDDVGDVATYWGEAPSLQRQAALETVKLIASRGCWSEKASSDVYDHPGGRRHGHYKRPMIELVGDVLRYFSFCDPWTILDDDASNIICYDTRHPANFYFRPDSREEHERWTREQRDHMTRKGWNLIVDRKNKPYLSAASVAINFLEGIPAGRRNIRNIVLNETHFLKAHPECHGLGLIKFCKENPELRVERRANLWKSILQTSIPTGEGIGDDEIYEDGITSRVALWVVEALALVSAGMPVGSFTLVLDGDPAPAQSAQLFQRVQRDAAWQTALSESFDRGLLPDTTYVDKRSRGGYTYEDFPQAMREISKGTCRAVRANFDVGEPWDAEAMIEAHRGWKLEDWDDKWFLDTRFQTAPPLPEWRVVRKESGRLTQLAIFDAP